MSELALLAVLAFAAPVPEPEKSEWNMGSCGAPAAKAGHKVIRDLEQWKGFWKELGQPAPESDLRRNFAVVVFLGQRPTGGYGVRFLEPIKSKKGLTIRYRETAPKGFAIQMLTEPCAVKLYKKTPLAVTIERAEK